MRTGGRASASTRTTALPCTFASLASGASQTITTAFNVPASYTTPNPAVNAVTASTSMPDPVATNNTSSVSTGVSASADVTITKTVNAPAVIADSALNYTVTVGNAGPSDAASVTITDVLPTNFTVSTIAPTGWTCSQAGQTVTCTLAAKAAGASSVITINGFAPPTAGTISNTASVTRATADPVLTNNTSAPVSTIVTTQADLSITKTASAKYGSVVDNKTQDPTYVPAQ